MKKYFLIFGLAISLFIFISCAKYPEEELTQAKQALMEAQTAGAKLYAEEKFESAKQFLKQAEASIQEKDFAKAKEKALEAIKNAQDAKAIAMKEKIAIKRDVEKSLVELKAIVNSITPTDSSSARKIDVAKELAKDAELAFNAGDFAKAKQKMDATRFLLDEVTNLSSPKVKPEMKTKNTDESEETKSTQKTEN